jgi:hypothetical protein
MFSRNVPDRSGLIGNFCALAGLTAWSLIRLRVPVNAMYQYILFDKRWFGACPRAIICFPVLSKNVHSSGGELKGES